MGSKLRETRQINNSSSIINEIDRLIILSEKLITENPNKSLDLGEKSYQLSKENNYTYGIGKSLYIIAFSS